MLLHLSCMTIFILKVSILMPLPNPDPLAEVARTLPHYSIIISCIALTHRACVMVCLLLLVIIILVCGLFPQRW